IPASTSPKPSAPPTAARSCCPGTWPPGRADRRRPATPRASAQHGGRRDVTEYPPGTVVPNPLRRRIDRALRIARVEEGMARRILARVADGPTRDRANRDLKDALTQQDLLEYVRPHVPPHAPIEKTELAGKLVHHTGELKDVMDAIRIVCANIEADLAAHLAPHLHRPREAKKV